MLDHIYSQAVEVDGKKQDKNLFFFSLSTCVNCKKAQRYLEEKGYAYKILFVDQLEQSEKEQLKMKLHSKYGMRVAFPALAIDDNRIVLGFIPPAWDEALGE